MAAALRLARVGLHQLATPIDADQVPIEPHLQVDPGWTRVVRDGIDRVAKRDVMIRMHRDLAPEWDRVGHTVVGQEVILLLVPEHHQW